MTTLPLTPDEVLTTTRTVRKRLDLTRPVPMSMIRECLEIALQAPSGSNRQGWEWLVITDPDRRAAVAKVYSRACEEYLESVSAAENPYADDPERTAVQQRIRDSTRYLSDHMAEVPVLVIPCIRAGRHGLDAGNQSGLWGSILPAAWSYMLAARARGLGTAWTTLHLTYEAEVAELLELPAGVAQALLIPTAYYTGETFQPAARSPLDDVLHIDRW
jgi:nitroreductase